MIFVERLIEIWGALWYDKIKIEDRRKKRNVFNYDAKPSEWNSSDS